MAVAYDNSNSAEGSSTNPTVSLTVAANSLALVGLVANNNPSISAATFDGNAMTLVHDHSGGAGVKIYRYHGHGSGSRTASFTLGSSQNWVIAVVSVTGFNTTTPVGTPQQGSSSEATTVTTAAITSATDGLVVDLAMMINSSMAPQSAQTQRQYRPEPNSAFLSVGMSTKPGAASLTMQWEASGTFGDNAIIGVPVNAAAASGYTLTCEQGSYSLTGQDVAVVAARNVSAQQGSYTLIGSEATRSLSMSLDTGGYNLSGQNATLAQSAKTLVAELGSYTLTGFAALRQLSILMGSGSYALTGNSIGLAYSGAAASIQGTLMRRRHFGFRLSR